jgi:hypothetical protein
MWGQVRLDSVDIVKNGSGGCTCNEIDINKLLKVLSEWEV